MKYFLIKAIGKPYDKRWYFKIGRNYAGRWFVNFNTHFGGLAFVFSSGNAHYLIEQTKEDQRRIENYKYPKREDGKLDMRYSKNKWYRNRFKYYFRSLIPSELLKKKLNDK